MAFRANGAVQGQALFVGEEVSAEGFFDFLFPVFFYAAKEIEDDGHVAALALSVKHGGHIGPLDGDVTWDGEEMNGGKPRRQAPGAFSVAEAAGEEIQHMGFEIRRRRVFGEAKRIVDGRLFFVELFVGAAQDVVGALHFHGVEEGHAKGQGAPAQVMGVV